MDFNFMNKLFGFLILFMAINCHAMDISNPADKWQEMKFILLNHLMKSVKSSGTVECIFAHTDIQKEVALRVCFKKEVSNQSLKQQILKLVKKKTAKFMKNRIKGFNKPINIMEYNLNFEDPELLPEIIKFSMKLFPYSNLTIQVWNELTKAISNKDRCANLRNLFYEICFANDINVPTWSFTDCKYPDDYIVRFTQLDAGLDKQSILLIKNYSDIERRFFSRIPKSIKLPQEGADDWQRFNLELVEFIFSKYKNQQLWSQAQNIISFAQDTLEKLYEAEKEVNTLIKETHRFVAIINLRANLLNGIQPKFLPLLVGEEAVSNLPERLPSEENPIKKRLEDNISRINSPCGLATNYMSLNSLVILIDTRIKEISFDDEIPVDDQIEYKLTSITESNESITPCPLKNEEPKILVHNNTPSVSLTFECKREAQQLLALQEQRLAKKSNRKGTKAATDNKESKSAPMDNTTTKIFSVTLTSGSSVQAVKAQSLVANANIYLSTDVIGNIVIDEKMKAFLGTADRMKILKQFSLGKNGIKIYGLDLLIAKNKKFPSEHLIFISYPVENNNGYVFLPYQIVKHHEYEGYLDDEIALEKLVSSARNAIKVDVNS